MKANTSSNPQASLCFYQTKTRNNNRKKWKNEVKQMFQACICGNKYALSGILMMKKNTGLCFEKKHIPQKVISAIGWSLMVTKVSKIVNKQFYRRIFRETMIFSTRIFMKNCYLNKRLLRLFSVEKWLPWRWKDERKGKITKFPSNLSTYYRKQNLH